MKQPLIRERSTDQRHTVLGLAPIILINVVCYSWRSIWHFIMMKAPWLNITRWHWVDVALVTVGAILALCFLGLMVRVAGLILWLFMCYLVDHYREGGDKREEWRERNREWSEHRRKMRPSSKFVVDTLGWVLWGTVGLGIIWGIRACSKAIIEPDNNPSAYYDPTP